MPTQIAGIVLYGQRGDVSPALAGDAASLCVDCGACEAHCHIAHPLPSFLRQARAEFLPAPPIDPLSPIEAGEGEGSWVAVEADDRPLAAALAHRLGEPVRRWPTTDRLGVAAVEHPLWNGRAAALREAVGDAKIVVADGGVAHALEASDIAFTWLHDLIGACDLRGSCRAEGAPGPVACCGGAGPLARRFPEDAERMGRWWLDRSEPARYADARCRGHLSACGGSVQDLIDQLVEEMA